MKRAVVLDASAALQLAMPDSEAWREAAIDLFREMAEGRVLAHVPIIFFNEVAAPCAKAVRGKRLSQAHCDAFFATLATTPLNLQVEVISPAQWLTVP